MKKLIMFLLVHINPNAIFSQEAKTLEYPPKPVVIDRYKIVPPSPDTLRAIVLVTLRENGPAVARMGFVVISDGKRPVYLDCQKKALKLPQVGWGWREVGVNKQ